MPIGRQDVNLPEDLRGFAAYGGVEDRRCGRSRYVTAMPGTYKLPEYGSTALRIDHSNYDYLDQEVALSLPGGDVECDLIDNGYDIRCEQRGGKLYIRLGGWFAAGSNFICAAGRAIRWSTSMWMCRCNGPFRT